MADSIRIVLGKSRVKRTKQLMNIWSKLSFRYKVLMYAFTVSCLTLFFSGVAFISLDWVKERQVLIEELHTVTSQYSGSLMHTLIENNPENAQDVLGSLFFQKPILGKWLYTHDNTLLASSQLTKESIHIDEQFLNSAGLQVQFHQLFYAYPLLFEGKRVGTFVVLSSLEPLLLKTLHQIIAVLLASLVSLCLAFYFALRIQKILVKPFNELRHTVRQVALSNDYSLRAKRSTADDFGVLTDAFNHMLDEVQTRNRALQESKDRLNLALWGSKEVMLDWDILTDSLYFDDNFELMMGIPKRRFPKKIQDFFLLQHKEDRIQCRDALNDHLKKRTDFFEQECRFLDHKKNWQWLLVRAKVVERDPKGRGLRLTGTLVNISERKKVQSDLRLIKQVFESITEGVMVTTCRFRIIETNPAFEVLTGYTKRQALTKSVATLLDNENEADALFKEIHQHLLSFGVWEGELWAKRQSREIYPCRMTISPIKNDKGTLKYLALIFSDITQHKRDQDQVQYLSNFDPLTNLSNRNHFMVNLTQVIAKASIEKKQVALCVIGIDNFKIINDSFGHSVGDLLLQALSKRLKGCAKEETDLARFSGDEFAIIFKNYSHIKEVNAFVKEIMDGILSNFVIDGQDILIGVSIGISLFPQDASEMQVMLKNADIALYHAKQKGKNSFKFFSPDMNEKVIYRQKLESHLRKAINNEEFLLYYQPKVDVKTMKIVGCEALVRWHNPELGFCSPAEFIPLAEETGLIVPLGSWVLNQACKQAKQWSLMGFTDLKVAVNLSPFQFRAGDLVREIAQTLWALELSPKILDLELTEGLLMDNTERCILMLRVLKAMGIQMSIDDFGTGYSSLSYLKRFPLDVLKIDQSFVKNMTKNHEDASIIKAIVAMAQGLGLKTVAEGVETIEQFNLLKSYQCSEVQGYYFSKPIEANAFTALMETYRDKAMKVS